MKDLGTRFGRDLVHAIAGGLGVEPDPEAGAALPGLLADALLQAPGFTLRCGTAAAAAVDLDPAESWPLDAARIRIAEAAGAVAVIGHQILGAIGFTDEHPLHRLTTRLWAWREEYGNHAIWSERLGSVLAGKDGLTRWQRMTR